MYVQCWAQSFDIYIYIYIYMSWNIYVLFWCLQCLLVNTEWSNSVLIYAITQNTNTDNVNSLTKRIMCPYKFLTDVKLPVYLHKPAILCCKQVFNSLPTIYDVKHIGLHFSSLAALVHQLGVFTCICRQYYCLTPDGIAHTPPPPAVTLCLWRRPIHQFALNTVKCPCTSGVRPGSLGGGVQLLSSCPVEYALGAWHSLTAAAVVIEWLLNDRSGVVLRKCVRACVRGGTPYCTSGSCPSSGVAVAIHQPMYYVVYFCRLERTL